MEFLNFGIYRIPNCPPMLQHGLILYIRNFKRSKSTFLIDFIGLSSGFCCLLLIYLWIHDELVIDKFHKNDEQLFQVVSNLQNSDGIITRDATPIGMAYVLRQNMPEVEHAATVTPYRWFPKFILSNGARHIKAEGKFAGDEFFEMFSYELIHGKKKTALHDKYSIVISEKIAEKLFGSAGDALNKPLPWQLSQIKKECFVTGVFREVTGKSSDPFDVVLPIDLLADIMGFEKDNLESPGPGTFVVLKKEADIAAFNEKITRFMRDKRTGSEAESFFATKYSGKYLYGKFENGVQTGGRIEYVKLFSLIAIFILFIAGINFINLANAKASRRLKEVGIKKAIGANRRTLILQYMAESMITVLISFVLALLLTGLLLPDFNSVTGKHLSLTWDFHMIVFFAVCALLTGLLAGSYPALYLTGFSPADILKGKLNSFGGEMLARKGLVIFQFAVSIVLIVSVVVTYRQIDYIQHKNIGFDKENVIYFENEGTIATQKDAFFSGLVTIPGVVSASGMIGNIVGDFGPPRDVEYQGKKIPFNFLFAHYGLIETLGIPLREGREFSREYSDSTGVIFNHAAVEAMHIKDPIGKVIRFGGENLTIIGVTENFHFHSLHRPITPMIIRLEAGQQWNIMVRISEGKEKETVTAIETLYKTFNPGFAFDYRFLNTDFQEQYASETRVAILSKYFAGLAVIISCLGLYGLAAFTTERRTKEIGIRKVLGATSAGIIYLLSAEFVKLVLIAIVIAVPASYFLAKEWLRNFAYSISIEAWYFLGAGIIALLIAILTVGSQAFKASLIAPTNCLKEE